MTAASTDTTREVVTRWARDLYANAVDRKDAAGFAAAFLPDGWVQFGNAPAIAGRSAIETAIAQFFSSFVALRHASTGTWLDGDTLTLEAEVTYTRHDGKLVTVPASTIFRLARGSAEAGSPQAKECRIYVDLTPLYAP